MRLQTVAVAIGLALLSVEAKAANRAEEAVQRGLRFMGAGEYDHAIREFLEAKELAPSPRTTAQIGIAEQALGHFVDAEIHMVDVLQAVEDPWVKKNRATLEQRLKEIQAHLGSLIVRGRPPGADVRLDGELVGSVPMRRPVRLPLGTVWMLVEAPGFRRKIQSVDIVAGEIASIDVDLKPVPSLSLQPPAPGPSAQVPHALSSPIEPGRSERQARARGRRVGWTFVVVGVFGAAAGTTLLAAGDSPKLGTGLIAAGMGAAAGGWLGVLLLRDTPASKE
jgi:hypothetical protein